MFVALTVEPHEQVDRQGDRRDKSQDDHDRGEVHPDQDQEDRTPDQLPQDAVDRVIDLLGLALFVCQLLPLLSTCYPRNIRRSAIYYNINVRKSSILSIKPASLFLD